MNHAIIATSQDKQLKYRDIATCLGDKYYCFHEKPILEAIRSGGLYRTFTWDVGDWGDSELNKADKDWAKHAVIQGSSGLEVPPARCDKPGCLRRATVDGPMGSFCEEHDRG